MTLRDVHNRCVVCGRPPSEACCGTCHQAHGTLKAPPDPRLPETKDGGIPRDLHINTEAANQ